MNLYPFQHEGIKFAMKHKRCLIADEMGLGKTVQAIGLINELGCHPTLVICPASLKLNWKNELERWLHHADGEPTHKIGIINGNKWAENTEISIISYDLLKKYRQQIREHTWGLLICDESHYIKNEKANRTEEILGSKTVEPIQADRVLFLTGTPILNRPSELWTTFRALAPEEFGSFFQFARRYCDAKKVKVAKDKEVWDFSGSSNWEELKGRMKKFSIRRTKDQVLKDLPPKRRQIIVLPNPAKDLTDEEIGLHDETEGLLSRIRELPFGSPEIQQYRDKRKLMLDQLAKIRVELADQKLPYVLEMMDSIDHKAVIFAHHRKLIEMLSLRKETVQLHGGMKPEERQGSVDSFQKDPSVKFFIGSLTAAGVGLTLTAASHVIFAESSWVPGVQQQCEDRCVAQGQLVLTEKGFVPIEKVITGDIVLTHNGNWKKVMDTYSRQQRDLMTTIKYQGFYMPLVTSAEHKILIKRGENVFWEESQNVKPRDFVVMRINGDQKLVQSIDISPDIKDRRTFINRWGGIHVNSRLKKLPNPLELTDDFLYFVGFYLANGFSGTGRNKGNFVSLAGHTNKLHILERIKTYLLGLGISVSPPRQGASNGLEIRAYSAELAELFFNWFGHGAHNKRIPEQLLCLPKGQLEHLLSGYVDGDGYKRNTQVEWVSVSLALASQMAYVASVCGFTPTFRRVDQKNATSPQYIGCYTEHMKHEGWCFRKVQSVEVSTPKKGKGIYKNFYDLTVEDDASYVVGLASVHNCHRIGQQDSVLVQYLVFEDSLDMRMMKSIETKEKIIRRAE